MLALGGPIALAATKGMLRAQRPASMQDDLAEMLALSGRHFTSDEGKEGMAAFLEKRKPSWVPPARREP
jgi:methylglutaconyl-CoA hydratase